MNILFINAGSYINLDMMNAVILLYSSVNADEMGYFFGNEDIYYNDRFESMLLKQINCRKYDLAISTNFYPVVARICNDKDLKYLAWCYDTPMRIEPEEIKKYDNSYVFSFDRIDTEIYKKAGVEKIYHLPLAIDTGRLDKFSASKRFGGDVSFVGKLYRPQIQKVKMGIDENLSAYVDKLISVQRGIPDRFVVEDLISQPILDEFNRQYKENGRKLKIGKVELSHVISEYVTYLDRVVILEMMARRFDTHFYTYELKEDEKKILKNVKIHGEINYFTEMPSMFKSNKINISGSFRAAKSAIPLRALDIMGCKAFLLSSSRPELLEHFEDGKELAIYSSEAEAVDKAGYYLEHESEREKIALAGYEKIKRDFGYKDRLQRMFELSEVKIN